jgi:hypothetical protein
MVLPHPVDAGAAAPPIPLADLGLGIESDTPKVIDPATARPANVGAADWPNGYTRTPPFAANPNGSQVIQKNPPLGEHPPAAPAPTDGTTYMDVCFIVECRPKSDLKTFTLRRRRAGNPPTWPTVTDPPVAGADHSGHVRVKGPMAN